jgi:hypothetical protein
MINNEPNDTPITKSMMDDARARRLAYFSQPITPAPRPARRDLPRRNRNHSVRHRAIR